MSAVPVAVRRIRRRVLAKDIRSGSRSAAAEACAISALIAWWTIRYAQISWWARSGSRERSTLPGPRRWVLSWSLLVSSCRVGPPHCCGGPPSEPCVRFVTAHGSSKPRGRHGLLVAPALAGLEAPVAGGVYQACSVPVRRVVSPVMGEVVGADRPSDGAQPPSFPLVSGLGWLIGAQQVVSAQGTTAILLGEQAG